MTRHIVVLHVEIDAHDPSDAYRRVTKAKVCLENSLAYAKPVCVIVSTGSYEATK